MCKQQFRSLIGTAALEGYFKIPEAAEPEI